MIPKYESLMLPLLKYISDGKEHSLKEVEEHLHNVFNLTEQEKKKLLPSGQEPVIHNRTGWARTYLKKAGFLEYTKRSHFRITERGLKVLEEKPSQINVKYLKRFPEFLEFQAKKKPRVDKTPHKKITELLDPKELLENAHSKINIELASELLKEIKSSSSTFFERIVVELLVKMGYGGSREDAGEAVGQTGDEGIDGIIKGDRLGLDTVYIQAKKWEGTVGRPEIQKFVGALQGQGATKGVFITTSAFSNNAIDYASKISPAKIVLVDGEILAELMIEFNIGVLRDATYEVKKIDLDFFS